MAARGARELVLALCVLAQCGARVAQAQSRPVWVIDGVDVGLPPAPNGESWDTAVGGLLTFNLRNILPDIQVCLESPHVPGVCTAVCQDAAWSTELNVYRCTQSLSPRGGLFLEENLHVQVREVDPGSFRTVGDLLIADPTACSPCTQALPGGTLTVAFSFSQVAAYAGPFRGDRGVLAPPSAPASPAVARPAAPASSPWDTVARYAKPLTDWYLRWRDPGGVQGAHDIAAEAAEASSRKSVLKLSQIARDHGLQSRMPLCASQTGAARESCLLNRVLNQSDAAYGEALAYLRGPHVQEQIDDLAKAKAHDVACSWFGFDLCRWKR